MTLTNEQPRQLPGTLKTANVSVANRALEQFYVPHDLRVASIRRFELDSVLVTATNVRVGLLKFGTDVSVDCQADPTGFVLSYAAHGIVEVASHGEQTTAEPTRATLLTAGRASRFDIPKDAALVTLSFLRGDVEAELSAMLGRPTVQPLIFDLGLDVGVGPGVNLLATAELLRRQVTDADNLMTLYPAYPVYAASLARAAMNALLLTFPHNYSDELLGNGSAEPMPSAIERAVRAVQDCPTTIHRAEDLAHIAALSLRALEAGFERYVGEPPMAYVRRVRLDRARAHLLAGTPDTLTVAEVANRWAFYHLGRFSATYRATFGENPSATLLRAATSDEPTTS
jgi:AraC-like DNA-binding protein